MGRHRKNSVYKYFIHNSTTNKSRCLINQCGGEVIGKHGTNLISHLSKNHPTEFTTVMLLNENEKRKSEEIEDSTSCSNDTSKRIKQDVLDICVNLVTIHGRPFSLINDNAFQKLVNMIPSCSTSNISSEQVRNAVTIKADLFRKQLKNKFKGELLSLKIDAATCMDRSFLGINVQYVDRTKLILHTLAVKEVYGKHTAINMKEIIKSVLNTYGISTSQIYSITTDNGSNMIKLVKLIGNEQLEVEFCNNDDENNSDSDSYSELSVNEGNINDNEEYAISLLDNEEVYVHSNDKGEDADKLKFPVRCVRCAAHTLQLAISDVLKEEENKIIINKARQICKKLRAPGVKTILKAMQKKKPIIDCPKRWNSTLDMLQRLLELKECCNDTNKELYLNPQTWSQIEELVRSLIPASIATKILQKEQLVIGDFYRAWYQCKLETTKINTPLARRLTQTMIAREKNLFNNDAFLAGMFLDARFNIVLTEEQRTQANNYLIYTWRYKEKLRQKNQMLNGDNHHSNNVPNTSTVCANEDDADVVETMLRELDAKKCRNNTVACSTDIINSIQKFLEYPRLNSKENILIFWDKNKNNMPELYSLAKVALAVPPTQVSVERLFSSLKYILSNLRYNLTADILNDILLLRANDIM